MRDARDLNNIETRAIIKFVFLQGKVPKEIYAILTVTLACFLPGRANDFSVFTMINYEIVPVTSLNKYLHYGTSGTE